MQILNEKLISLLTDEIFINHALHIALRDFNLMVQFKCKKKPIMCALPSRSARLSNIWFIHHHHHQFVDVFSVYITKT